MSIQGYMDGGQVRDIFQAYNDQEGSIVVDMSRNYNTGDEYSNKIGTGNQIDLALKEINAYRGDEAFGTEHMDWSNGRQLKALFAKMILLVGADDNPPIWMSSLPLNVEIVQGAAWPWACTAYAWSSIVMTFTNNLTIPTGITLGTDGVFTGTATNISSGTIELVATNANGSTLAPWIKWAVVPA